MNSPAQVSAAELQQQREEIRCSLRRVTIAGAIIVLVVMALAVAAIMAAYRSSHHARQAESATERARQELWNSYLAQARAGRLSGIAGHKELVTFQVENLPFGVIVDNIGLNGVRLSRTQGNRLPVRCC
jgi:hypothetical protein